VSVSRCQHVHASALQLPQPVYAHYPGRIRFFVYVKPHLLPDPEIQGLQLLSL